MSNKGQHFFKFATEEFKCFLERSSSVTFLFSLFLSCSVQGRFKLKKAKANQGSGKNDSNPSAPSPSQSQASNPPSQSQASNPPSQSQASNPPSESDFSKLGQGQEVDSKQEVEEEMPDLNDPEVQKATSFMQVAN